MMGEMDDDEGKGVIPRIVLGLFDRIAQSPPDIQFIISVSMIEIYNEKIRDLLDTKKDNLKIHESKDKGIYVKDMTEEDVGSVQEVYDILHRGTDNRAIGKTNMNAHSSRSHSVFVLTVE